MKNFSLQYITDRAEGLEDALRGGCRWVQLRMKDASDSEICRVGGEVKRLCRQHGATFILDDRPDLALAIGADGVHLGKNDMPLREARGLRGQDFIIGATANTLDDIIAACAAGADYVGLGPFRFTTTKKNLSPLLGLEGYEAIMKKLRELRIQTPVVAIGGITLDDIQPLRKAGVDGIAVSGLIQNSPDKENITHQIINKWKTF